MTDANINLSDCSTPREESPLSKRPRKQQQPKKIVSAAEIRVVRRSPKRRRKRDPVDFISRLRDKHISFLIMRKGLRCFWCRSWSEVFPYHTVSSLALHKLWHHRKDKFGCEHCKVRYRHRYQVVLHSSRAHLPKISREQVTNVQIEQNNENLQNSVPVMISRTVDVLPPINSIEPKSSEPDPPVSAAPISTDLEVSMKIPNFLSSLHELQPSFKSNFVFRTPDSFTNKLQELAPNKNNSIPPIQDIKSYQIIKSDDISLKNNIPIQDLYTQVKSRPEEVQELRPEVPSNNNNISQLDMPEKNNHSIIENSQIQELMDPSLQGGAGPMSLVIPSYPPSG